MYLSRGSSPCLQQEGLYLLKRGDLRVPKAFGTPSRGVALAGVERCLPQSGLQLPSLGKRQFFLRPRLAGILFLSAVWRDHIKIDLFLILIFVSCTYYSIFKKYCQYFIINNQFLLLNLNKLIIYNTAFFYIYIDQVRPSVIVFMNKGEARHEKNHHTHTSFIS